VKHTASPDFWGAYHTLPESTRALADGCFKLLKANPRHPSLRLKRVGRFWSVRAGLHHRALGLDVPDGIVWFWIGTHAQYDRLIAR
jgi:hypothetical protein